MNDANTFNPSRLILARERSGLTKRSLAERVGLTPKTISNLEKGDHFSIDSINAISDRIGYPVSFFFKSDQEKPMEEDASFRSFSRVTATQKNSALAAGAYAFMVSDWISQKFHLPDSAIPDLGAYSPDLAAQMLRKEWGLGNRPVKNMIHLLESKGVMVFSLAEENAQVNAFSCWQRAEKPYVFLNSFKSAESSRFDAAHELGHLVLHKNKENKGKEAEYQADTFASEFLMPSRSILSRCGGIKTLRSVLKEKQYWFVSAFALTFKLHKVGLLTDWAYRALCIEMSQKGYRKKEPIPGVHEKSQVLKKILDQMRGNGKSISCIADDLSLPEKEIAKLFFNIATVAVPNTKKIEPSSSSPPKLRLIK